MKKIILLIGVFSIVSQSINAQIIFNDDTTVCGIQPFTLNAISSDVDSLVTDDAYTDVVDIGFNFDFYGNTYNKMLISSNGYVTFDTSNATGYSPYSINTPIPNPGFEPENAILVTWQDTDPNFGGAIYFGSYGASPNKVYVVTWCAIPMFSCNQLIYTSQLRMYEGSNKIEMYLQDRPLCLTWNGGAGIQGTVDATSTNFDVVNDPIILGNPPRNFPTLWTATNEGWEFIPNGITSFNINQIPFTPVAAGNTTWTDALGNIIGLGSSINVMPSITTTYYANMNSLCSGSLVDSVTITVGSSITSNVSAINASCRGNDAQITVVPNQGITQPPWTINLLNLNGSVVQTQINVMNSHSFTNLFPGSYMAQVVEPQSGCSGVTNVSVGQDSIFLNLSISQQNVSCYDGCDASISIQASGGLLPYNYYIDGVLNPLPFPGDSVFSDLCGGIYIVSVTDNNDCMIRDTITVTTPNS
ncbi:SprB repeat-containing protein, partial [Flavobacteriales bacterium]|nr:SprB repeat-containing protein [Flavobacteriales bacterium]